MSDGFDLNRLRTMFAAEAAELLAAFEQGILHLEQTPDDRERVHEVFRSAHSLKGGAATLGLSVLVEVTHELETLLDAWRTGKLTPGRLHFDALLRAADWLRQALSADDAEAANNAARVSADLRALLSSGAVAQPAAVEAQPRASAARYSIKFAPHTELFALGGDPLLVIRELRDLAQQIQIAIDISRLPALERIDPETAYVAWSIELVPAPGVTRERVVDAFAFVEASADITVETIDEEATGATPPPAVDAPSPPPTSPSSAITAPASAGAALDSTIRVATEKVDALVDLVGEVVISHSVIRELVRRGATNIAELREAILKTDRHLRELQERVMAVRTVPLSVLYARVPRIVREVAARLGKQVQLEMEGGETELDKVLVERMVDPVLHLVRNALDHGLESPEARLAAGKVVTGKLTLRTYARGGNVYLEVCDDGRGLDRERIIQVAQQRGLITAGAELTDAQVSNLISAPGFSTASQVTDLSGRGVGLDVVRRNIEQIGGSLVIESEAGRGTQFRMRLPLTLTIMDGLQVTAAGQTWLIPLVDVAFSLRLDPSRVRSLAGLGQVIDLENETLPVVSLSSLLERYEEPTGDVAVVIHAGASRYALRVDALLGQTQIVVKSIETHFRRVTGIMGATILGDGKVALIIDGQGLAASAGLRNHGSETARSGIGSLS